ncbi:MULTISPECIES: cell wall hydrolase P40 [Lacticaseibacillus]|jgi:peptidoglycan hydrolase CwlO-like protein|uniref:Secreted protein n=1 Tax=Lacticaseibacillus casei DSM 20011 = JCM 1134 = ATCC 393 TaxID=1423732 RepID=A0AAD1AP01_LACCA|nr:cell wall hydrolase P40 [Lacticaseibacillus casei]MBI6598788.1 CHAP domain-containing protein [Lacticaseibacillus casei]MBO1482472.1 cell wall hydrolase P40 [Lacticaseibacillus casei]MBO2417708.1 cell wall hydrolase P40 [Lacticaseibacillus casei]MCK2082100.1 cell wall hydrolase P40 [Lacticaseibacillus casei]MDZ5495049.1 cell wall hydrolase P40 [Lacticaseibacillus casei]
MKFNKAMITLVAAVTLAGSASAVTPVFADTSASIASNKSETNDLLKQIEAANTEVINLNKQIDDKNSQISDATAKISATDAQIKSLSGQITAAQKNVTARKNNLKDQLISLQKKAGSSVSGNVYIDFVLNSQSLSDLIARTMTVGKLSQASKEALDAVTVAKDKLAGLKNQQETARQTLVSTKSSLETQKSQLVTLQKTASDKQDALNKQINDHRDELVALQSQFAQEQEKTAAATQAALKTVAASTGSASSKSAESSSSTTKAASSQSTLSTTSTSSNSGASSSVISNTTASGSGSHADYSTSGNTYPWGQCTWYVKSVASWAGNGWGNGAEWGASAAAAGFTVNHTPAAGSIIVFAAGQSVGGQWTADGQYGHVAYVQSVSGDSVTISQGGMGFSSPTGPNTQTISGASSYTYIHR